MHAHPLLRLRRLLCLAVLALAGCGGGGAAEEPNVYYHFVCNGDGACLSTNFAGAPYGTSNQGPGQGGVAGCNGLINFGNINWNIPPAQQWCDNSPGFAAPALSIAVSPTSIDQGQSSTLTWSSDRATSCTASNAWSGAKALDGSLNVGPTSGGNYTYALTCQGPGGSVTRSATLTVVAPAISISVTPAAITDGQSATLTWSSDRTVSCTASDAWTGTAALSGTRAVSPSTGTYTYTLTCTGTGGSPVTNAATLTVSPSSSLQSPPTATISVSPSNPSAGQAIEVTWSSTRASDCTAYGSWSGPVALSGVQTLGGRSAGTYDYTITCNGSGGSASATASVVIIQAGTVTCSPPSVSIGVAPASIVEGQSSTLTWSATPDPYCSLQSVTCTASGSWSGDVADSGSTSVAPSAGSFTYTLNCSGRNAVRSRSATLTVSPAASPPAPFVDISVAPVGINLGDSAVLSWSTSGVRSCTASGAWSGAVGLGGSLTVAPSSYGSYDYVLTCLGSGANAGDTATLSVEQAAGTTSTARFNNPYHLELDSADNLFIVDGLNQTIRKITPANVVTTVAGLPGATGSADGTGATARFNNPFGIAIDAANQLYIGDVTNNTIRKITTAALVSTLAGLAPNSGAVDDTGPAARFYNPVGLAVDASGNIYVADKANHTIRRVTPAGVVTTVAGLAGTLGSADGTGSAARFYYPEDIAIDAVTGILYVADSYNNTIRKIEAGGVVTTLAGMAGTSGYDDGTGSAARFSHPASVATDSAGNIYVADPWAHVIRKVTPAGVVTTFAGGAGIPGYSDSTGTGARFTSPSGVATDSLDNVYVADTYYCVIRKITPGAVVTTIAGVAGACGSTN